MEGEAFELIFDPSEAVGERLDVLIDEADETTNNVAQILTREWGH